ncbi:MAG: hypothetical protein QOF31_5329 [Mycobacterium sp.]|jgi:hypothetical protein|nr:hypothetical protein [Mycobacterium sp.]
MLTADLAAPYKKRSGTPLPRQRGQVGVNCVVAAKKLVGGPSDAVDPHRFAQVHVIGSDGLVVAVGKLRRGVSLAALIDHPQCEVITVPREVLDPDDRPIAFAFSV